MSFWECMIILLVALVVIKPERLPEISYYLGRLCARFKRLYREFQEKYDF